MAMAELHEGLQMGSFLINLTVVVDKKEYRRRSFCHVKADVFQPDFGMIEQAERMEIERGAEQAYVTGIIRLKNRSVLEVQPDIVLKVYPEMKDYYDSLAAPAGGSDERE